MKIVLNDTMSGYNLSAINDNFTKIQDTFNNDVLYRDNPEGEPNQMIGTTLDMNGNPIINLPAPLNANDAARLKDVQDAIAGANTATLIKFTPYLWNNATNVQGAIQEVMDANKTELSLYSYGAVGDGVTDDSAAVQLWLNAQNSNTLGTIPVGTFRITQPLTKTGNGITLVGKGPNSKFLYDGVSTTPDIFTFGDGVVNAENWTLKDFAVTSTKQLTGGKAFRLNRFAYSSIIGVTSGHLDETQKMWDSFYLAGCHVVFMSHCVGIGRNDGTVVFGIDGNSNVNLYISDCYFDFNLRYNLHVAGGFGGLFVTNTELMGAGKSCFRVDNEFSSANNRELLLSDTVTCDGLQSTDYTIHIADQSQGLTFLCNAFMGSGRLATFKLEKADFAHICIGSNLVAFSAGDAFQIDIANAVVYIGGNTVIDNNAGIGINATVPTTNITFKGKFGVGNTGGNYSLNTNLYLWNGFVPTISYVSGTIGSYVINNCAYERTGRTVRMLLDFTITNVGSGGSGGVVVTLPYQCGVIPAAVHGREYATSGFAIVGIVSAASNQLSFVKFDNTFPATVNGSRYALSFFYETDTIAP